MATKEAMLCQNAPSAIRRIKTHDPGAFVAVVLAESESNEHHKVH